MKLYEKVVADHPNGQSMLDSLYSSLLNAASWADDTIDAFHGADPVYSDAQRALKHIEQALKCLNKYCEDNYL